MYVIKENIHTILSTTLTYNLMEREGGGGQEEGEREREIEREIEV